MHWLKVNVGHIMLPAIRCLHIPSVTHSSNHFVAILVRYSLNKNTTNLTDIQQSCGPPPSAEGPKSKYHGTAPRPGRSNQHLAFSDPKNHCFFHPLRFLIDGFNKLAHGAATSNLAVAIFRPRLTTKATKPASGCIAS